MNLSKEDMDKIDSATYLEDYFEGVEQLPEILQRSSITNFKELDCESIRHMEDLELAMEGLLAQMDDNDNDGGVGCVGSEDKNSQDKREYRNAISSLTDILVRSQQVLDQKLAISTNMQETLENKARILMVDQNNLASRAESSNSITKTGSNSNNRGGGKGKPTRTRMKLSTMTGGGGGSRASVFNRGSGGSARRGAFGRARGLPPSRRSHRFIPPVVTTEAGTSSSGLAQQLQSPAPPLIGQGMKVKTKAEVKEFSPMIGEKMMDISSPPPKLKIATKLKLVKIGPNDKEVERERPILKAVRTMPKKKKLKKNNDDKEKEEKDDKLIETSDDEEDEEEDEVEVEEDVDPDEPKYCICNKISYGEMVSCDNTICPFEWFHFDCVKLKRKPKGDWYCPRCRDPDSKEMKMKPRSVLVQELQKYNDEMELEQENK